MWYKVKRILIHQNWQEKQVRPWVTETYTISNIPTNDTNIYVNVAKSWKTVDTITFNAVVNYVSEKDCFMFIASNASNTNRYWLQYRARSNTDWAYTGTWLYIRWRLNWWSESVFRKSTNWYSTSSNTISYTINRNWSCSFTCNWQTTSYTATGSELTMLQTIINSSSVTVYSSQEASVISWNKVDATVTYS